MKSEEGFTLIELLVVIVMIGALTAMAIPLLTDAMKRSYRASAIANARICLSEYRASQVENDPYTPPAGCNISNNGSSCTCTVSGFAGSATCTFSDGGNYICQ